MVTHRITTPCTCVRFVWPTQLVVQPVAVDRPY